MAWEPVLWLIFSSINLALLASNIYQPINLCHTHTQFISFSDLEEDYVNPYELSSRVNSVIVPEYIVHVVLSVLFLVTGHWIMFLISLPPAYYNLKQYLSRQHLIDVTEVFRSLSAEKKARLIKIGYYGIFLALVIVRLVLSVIYHVFDEDDEELHGYGIP